MSVGILEDEIEQVLATDKYKDILIRNKHFCSDNNVVSVPTFIKNNQVIMVGTQNSKNFKRVFKSLKNKEQE